MKKGRYILLVVAFLLVAALVGAGLYFYPTWKAAKILEEKMGLSSLAYELEVKIDREKLPEEQRKTLDILAELTGVSEDAIYQLTIEGSAQGDKIGMTIYPEGAAKPLTEIYLEGDTCVINETMLYDAVRSQLTGQYPLLGYLMPEQKETQYITLEQIEQLFGVELGEIRAFHLPKADSSLTAKQYFILLAAMSREKQAGGWQFGMDAEQARLRFEIEGDSSVNLQFHIQNPSQTLPQGAWLLSRIGIEAPDVQLDMVESFSVALTPEENATVTMPTNSVSQSVIDMISEIRTWLEGIFAEESSESVL